MGVSIRTFDFASILVVDTDGGYPKEMAAHRNNDSHHWYCNLQASSDSAKDESGGDSFS